MRLIRVMCSGRIDMSFVLRAFSKGADGVFIGACHLTECNYITHGNYHTLNNPLDNKTLMTKLQTVTELIPYIRLVERERLRAPVMSEEDYYKLFASNEVKRLLQDTIYEKLAIGQIVSLLRGGPLTTSEIANGLGLTPSEVSKHLNTSSRHKLVRFDESLKRYAIA